MLLLFDLTNVQHLEITQGSSKYKKEKFKPKSIYDKGFPQKYPNTGL